MTLFSKHIPKNAENLPIEVKFSDGTLRTAFPTGVCKTERYTKIGKDHL